MRRSAELKTSGTSGKPDPPQRFLEALLEGNDEAACGAVTSMLADGASISEIYLQLFTAALVRMGDLWRRRKINVAQQKLATEITLGQMDRLRSLGVTKQKSPHRALVCCIKGELHSVGARMAADLLRLEGWTVDFLGPDVPTEAIVAMVKTRQPQVLGLSVTMKANLRHVRALLDALGKLAVRPRVVIGGQATTTLTRWKINNLDFNVAPDLIDGLNGILNVFRSAQPKANLEQYLKEIGQRIRELRTGSGHTQAQLAESAGLNRAYIVSVEHGKQNISMAVVIKIANALGVPTERLLLAG
jgi:methanogenic corrinoid protein MtbC1/DNA-binding XRE family transcriptional regulator